MIDDKSRRSHAKVRLGGAEGVRRGVSDNGEERSGVINICRMTQGERQDIAACASFENFKLNFGKIDRSLSSALSGTSCDLINVLIAETVIQLLIISKPVYR